MIHDETQRQTDNPTVSLGDVGKKLGAAIVATAEYRHSLRRIGATGMTVRLWTSSDNIRRHNRQCN